VIRLVGCMGGVVLRPDAPWRTMRELLDHARANPGTLFYGTSGANTTDVTMTRLARSLGIEWTSVPFRGAAPNLQNLLDRQVHFSAETSAWADDAPQSVVQQPPARAEASAAVMKARPLTPAWTPGTSRLAGSGARPSIRAAICSAMSR